MVNKALKNILFFILLISSSLLFAKQKDGLPDRPNPHRYVNVLTSQPFLSQKEQITLEQKLALYSDTSSNQIAIVIVDDLQGMPAYQYATELGEKWGVGQKKFDNGVVILISVGGKKGNRDYFIAVGYGLEGALPDLRISRIENSLLVPHLKNGEYFKALDKTTDAIIHYASGEYSNDDLYGTSDSKAVFVVLGVFFLIVIFIIYNLVKDGRRNTRSLHSGKMGFFAILFEIFKLIIIAILSNRGGKGNSSGGGYGGGGSFGGGSFGGGSFGGGGAGGKW